MSRLIVPVSGKGHSWPVTSAPASESKTIAAPRTGNQIAADTVEREVKDHLGLVAEMIPEFTSSLDFDVVVQSALERIAKFVEALDSIFAELLSDLAAACAGP